MDKDMLYYLNLPQSQHKVRPRFMKTLAAFLSPFDGAYDLIRDTPSAFDVYTATGNQLDVIGQRVGVSRSFPATIHKQDIVYLDDEMFRMVILMRIVQNHWDGADGTFDDLWNSTVRDLLGAVYTDNQDMTMGVHIFGRLEFLLMELIMHGYIIPIPMGVGMKVNYYGHSIHTVNAMGIIPCITVDHKYVPANDHYVFLAHAENYTGTRIHTTTTVARAKAISAA